MMERVFWERELKPGSSGYQRGFDAYRITLRYEPNLRIWQRFFFALVNGRWIDGSMYIEDIALSYLDSRIDVATSEFTAEVAA